MHFASLNHEFRKRISCVLEVFLTNPNSPLEVLNPVMSETWKGGSSLACGWQKRWWCAVCKSVPDVFLSRGSGKAVSEVRCICPKFEKRSSAEPLQLASKMRGDRF